MVACYECKVNEKEEIEVKLFALTAAVVLLASQFVFSQEEHKMEEVVVTATKTEKLLMDVPVRTEVITGEEIEAKGAVNLYEALEGIPGVRVEEQCSYCNFSIARMQGLEAGTVQVLIDGQPIYSGLAGVYGLQQIPAVNIERIEIIEGSSSALYGSSAIAGVINIITKKPGKEPMAEVITSFGTDSTNVYTLAASTRAENMDIMLTVQKNTGDAIDEDGDGLTDRVKTDNIGGGIRINWYDLFSDEDTLTFSGRTLNESRAGGELATFVNPFAASAENIDSIRYESVINYKRERLYGDKIGISLADCTHEREATNDSFLGD
jgi:outer membrane receptor for ferrienterochelin and colicins